MDRRQRTASKLATMAKRSQFGARIRLALREKLEAAAQENGRSVSEEVEMRLEASFIFEGVLSGPEALRMAATFEIAGQRAAEYEDIAAEEWRANRECYEAAILAVAKMVWVQHPKRREVEWSWREWCGRLTSYLGGFFGATREDIATVPVSNADHDAGQRDRAELVR